MCRAAEGARSAAAAGMCVLWGAMACVGGGLQGGWAWGMEEGGLVRWWEPREGVVRVLCVGCWVGAECGGEGDEGAGCVQGGAGCQRSGRRTDAPSKRKHKRVDEAGGGRAAGEHHMMGGRSRAGAGAGAGACRHDLGPSTARFWTCDTLTQVGFSLPASASRHVGVVQEMCVSGCLRHACSVQVLVHVPLPRTGTVQATGAARLLARPGLARYSLALARRHATTWHGECHLVLHLVVTCSAAPVGTFWPGSLECIASTYGTCAISKPRARETSDAWQAVPRTQYHSYPVARLPLNGALGECGASMA